MLTWLDLEKGLPEKNRRMGKKLAQIPILAQAELFMLGLTWKPQNIWEWEQPINITLWFGNAFNDVTPIRVTTSAGDVTFGKEANGDATINVNRCFTWCGKKMISLLLAVLPL